MSASMTVRCQSTASAAPTGSSSGVMRPGSSAASSPKAARASGATRSQKGVATQPSVGGSGASAAARRTSGGVPRGRV